MALRSSVRPIFLSTSLGPLLLLGGFTAAIAMSYAFVTGRRYAFAHSLYYVVVYQHIFPRLTKLARSSVILEMLRAFTFPTTAGIGGAPHLRRWRLPGHIQLNGSYDLQK